MKWIRKRNEKEEQIILGCYIFSYTINFESVKKLNRNYRDLIYSKSIAEKESCIFDLY